MLSKRVTEEPLSEPPRSICGMDVSYSGRSGQSCRSEPGTGAAVVLSYPELQLLEVRTVRKNAPIAYMPTFLAYREMPFFVALLSALKEKPSLFLINGHGVYHPAFFGAASHFGVVFGVPTIGVAGKPLHIDGEKIVGDEIVLHERRLAKVVRPTSRGQKCGDGAEDGKKGRRRALYVSVGNRIVLDQAAEIVCSCIVGHRMPEPLFLADAISREETAWGRFVQCQK